MQIQRFFTQTKQRSGFLAGIEPGMLALALATVFACLHLLANPMDRWDGAAHSYLALGQNRAGLHFMGSEIGLPLLAWLIDTLGRLADVVQLPFWTVAKAFMLLVLIGIARESFQLGLLLFNGNRPAARWAAAFTLAFPGYAVLQSSGQLYVCFVLCALLGHRLTHRAAGDRNWVYLVTGWALMAVSFQMNSNLVTVLALEAVRWAMRDKSQRWRYGQSAALLVTSVLGYLAFRHWFGPVGYYAAAGYNEFVSPFSHAGFVRHLKTLAGWLTWAALPLACVFAAVLVQPRRLQWHRAKSPSSPNWPFSFSAQIVAVMVSLFLCAAAVFPYMAVGKFTVLVAPQLASAGSVYAGLLAEFEPSRWISGFRAQNLRHTMLLGPFIALLTVALMLRIFHANKPHATPSKRLSAGFAVWLGISFFAHDYSLRQGVIDRAVVKLLASAPQPKLGAFVVMQREQRPVYWYDSTESAYLLYQAYGKTAWRAATVYAASGRSFETIIDYGTRQVSPFYTHPPHKQAATRQWALMDNYTPAPCIDYMRISAPTLRAFSGLWSALSPQRFPAQLTSRHEECGQPAFARDYGADGHTLPAAAIPTPTNQRP